MRSLPIVAAVVAVLVANACTGGPPTIEGIREVRAAAGRDGAQPQAVEAVATADADFALALYGLLATREGNLFYSPYSISTALSMTYAGGRGQTASQLASALGIDVEDAAWHAGRNSLELALAAERRVPEGLTPLKLAPTNGLFGQDGFAFEAEFLRILAADYGAGLQAVDFATRTEAARGLINAWVAARTADRIKELLPQGSVNDLTRLVLVNAIYFKGMWLNQFNPKATAPAPFHTRAGGDVTADQMRVSLMTSYADGDGWQSIRLPYAGSASMLLIVPDDGQFAEIENKLDAERLAQFADEMAPAEVNLDMPKWESKNAIDLVPALKAAGITDLFEPGTADLTGISTEGDLYVSGVLHQANITVNEEGTEAAAATAVIAGATSAPAKIVSLSVDRPFLYFITDDLSGEILFVGRVVDPTAG